MTYRTTASAAPLEILVTSTVPSSTTNLPTSTFHNPQPTALCAVYWVSSSRSTELPKRTTGGTRHALSTLSTCMTGFKGEPSVEELEAVIQSKQVFHVNTDISSRILSESSACRFIAYNIENDCGLIQLDDQFSNQRCWILQDTMMGTTRFTKISRKAVTSCIWATTEEFLQGILQE